MIPTRFPPAVDILGADAPGYNEFLTRELLEFVTSIERRFRAQRSLLLETRRRRQIAFDAGVRPDSLPETARIRGADWTVAPIPADLMDRRVELSGSVDRRTIIDGLNSGAQVFVADFEDATSPTWNNIVEGQINLRDAIDETIEFTDESGRYYALRPETATLIVRPRGWHLAEKHVLVDGQRVSASLFDVAVFLFHNAARLVDRGSGPYFYLPKLESHLEARLWNEVFEYAQDELGIPRGTIKATVLIETVPAAFQMNEILFELREHSSGLGFGRWDYVFSMIKTFRKSPSFLLPDRALLTAETPFLRSCSKLVVETCHRRGVHAIGAMTARLPIESDRKADEVAAREVVEDKLREVREGHDGTLVAHPGLVPLALHVFDAYMESAHQIDRKDTGASVSTRDLLLTPDGTVTESGLRANLRVGIQFISAWLHGRGAVAVNHRLEETATTEVSRALLWQWLHHPDVVLEDGRAVTPRMVELLLREELTRIEDDIGTEAFAAGRCELAASLLEELITSEEFVDFLTLSAYERL